MDDFEKVLDSISKPSSCADKVPEGLLEPTTEAEVEGAYKKGLEQIIGKLTVKNTQGD